MTTAPAAPRRGRKRRILLVVLGAAVVFVAGVALGEALQDNSNPGESQTIVRTLNPLPLLPAPATTVTVTTSKP